MRLISSQIVLFGNGVPNHVVHTYAVPPLGLKWGDFVEVKHSNGVFYDCFVGSIKHSAGHCVVEYHICRES